MSALRSIGRYQLSVLIGSGAMGDIYEAHDPVIDRRVAIKVLRPELIARGEDGAGWLERFRQEARAAGRLLHPNIVTVLDYGEEAGAPFLAMEFVEGEALDAVLKRNGRLGERDALAIMDQVLGALEFAHAHGVVHRDVKPANILLVKTGLVKIADFGIARIESSDLTIAGDILGTPSYMSPEQLAGKPVDGRSDLFSAGAVLFELLSGSRPFGKGMAEILVNMERRGPADLCGINPEIAPALRTVIETALALDPERRYRGAAQFARALAEARPRPAGPIAEMSAADEQPGAEATVASHAAPPAARETVFGAESLTPVERDLATFIGPVARILVRRSATTARSIAALYSALAVHIPDEGDRARFIRAGEVSTRGPRSGPDPTGRPASRHEEPIEVPAALTPETLHRIELALTRYIGPIARVVLRKQLRKSNSLSDLYRDLAVHIPDERDRESFLASFRGG
jgi:serine/threonine-protein kinase